MTTNPSSKIPTAKEADIAYNAGYRAGLHNSEHKKAEWDLSPDHYTRGYDDGRSDRQDKFHYSVNPNGVSSSRPRRPKRTKNSTVRINPTSDMYTRGYRDATDNLVKDASLRNDAEYQKGYHDAYDYRVMTGKGIKARYIPNPTSVQHKSAYMGPKNRYFPKVKPGRPAGGPKGGYWWSLDLYDNNDKMVSHKVGNGTKEKAIADAKSFVGLKVKHKIIQRTELHGPYKTPPSKAGK